MNVNRAYDIAQRAARQTALGPRAMSNSYNQAAYQQAQAKAMQAKNKAYGQAYGQMKVAGKNAALQKAKNVNAAKNVGGTASHPTGQPNKGDYGKPNRQAQAEARRSAGTSFTQQKLVEQRKASGSKMERTPEQNRMDAERRRIAGGSAGTITRAEVNRRAAEERRAGGFSKTTDVAQSRKSNYQALVNRRTAEQRRTGVTSNQAVAEARRIAGGSQGTSKSVKTAVERRAKSAYNKASDAVNEGNSLVKKGKKKVKSLMKRFFG